jgi:hypothetical protein
MSDRLTIERMLGRLLTAVLLAILVVSVAFGQNPDTGSSSDSIVIDLPFPFGGENPFNPVEDPAGFDLDWPSNFQYEMVYDDATGLYSIRQTIGDTLEYRPTTFFTLDEFLEYDMQGNLSEYWNDLQVEDDEADRAFAPKLTVDSKLFESIFGSNTIEIKPQGSAELTFGLNISNTENPRIPERQRRITTFDFDQRIQLNIGGKIGDKIELGTNYNTEALFDFENQMNIGFQGEEDDILKNFEAGHISMPLPGTLITGSQSLFGVKLETQWGRLYNTTVFSQQKGERKEIEVEGGAQTQEFDIRADDYEANRHYFISQYFRNQYDQAMRSLPVPNSGVNITRIEVWVVNIQANTQDIRNVIGFTDLGEHPNYISSNLPVADLVDGPDLEITEALNPSNRNNELYDLMVNSPEVLSFTGANGAIAALNLGLTQGVHYERVGNARKLATTEFTYNSRLGFISLRQALNNAEVLAVAYEYTLNGESYQVGTLSQDGFSAPSALMLKMLKSSITQLKLSNGDPSPLWQIMMKNVYSMQAFGLSQENFRLNLWYNDPATGVDLNYIPRAPLDGTLLLQLLGMDRLDINGMTQPDGVFDFVDNAATLGGTIHSQNGRIFFPSIEPFGSNLKNEIEARVDDPNLAQNLISSIVFQPLYDSTKTAAQQIPSLNRFRIKGEFQSQTSSEISLNAMNVPEGSVTVTAGGVRLIENQDYTVDYLSGRVRIINDGLLESGRNIKVSLESNSLFSIQTKTMMGTRFDYVLSDKFNIGATFLNLRERPLTQKVNVGNEPINNSIVGADFAWQTESQLLTDLVDLLPFYETTAKSSIDISAEAAYLIPGHSRAIGDDGNAYVDDFEGSQSAIDIRSVTRWFLASTPKLQSALFPEGNLEDSLTYNYNRAALSWYTVDPQFFRGAGLEDGQVSAEVKSDHRSREVLEGEVFPNRELPTGTPPNIPTLDLTFRPNERGPYNYELPEGAGGLSSGLNPEGSLADPASRWGGIQRALTTTDFEAANIEYLQFWMMDPFNEDSENLSGGDLYFNLGNVSEDVLNDSQLSYENGLPSANNPDLPTLESVWGIYPDPATFNVVNAFDNTSGNYDLQDVGLDGLPDNLEQTFFGEWLNELSGWLDNTAYQEFLADPSADNFRYFRDPEAQQNDETILDRYKRFNGNEGNSNTESPNGYPVTSTTIPNTEDINQDITLSTIESYFQYKVSLRPQDMGEVNIGNNYITDTFETVRETADGQERTIRWYQFKIPVREFESRVGGITDFRSVRFIRMFMKGWSEPVTLRFARLELIRGEWRRYLNSLAGPQEIEPDDPSSTSFNISAVNIEENGNREPVPYVTPPGIIREIDVGTANQRRLNEQSLELAVCGLSDGDARGAYRNINFDMRMYKRLRMYVHAEAGPDGTSLDDNELTCFVRLGNDFESNYYEFEIPLTVTPWNTGDEDLIWPLENNIDIEFRKLQNLKIERPAGYPLFDEYHTMDGSSRLAVKGNPNLANVVMVMVGVRNPDKDDNEFEAEDDGLDKCGVVWVNEMRLADFNEQGGWAAIAQMNAKLADLGNISVAANMSVPGFGGLEQRLQARQRETIQGIDASGTVQLGKLLPKKLGITLPMYLGWSEQVSTPQFDPLSPDIEMASQEGLSSERRENAKNVSRLRSVNFSNIKIDPQVGGGGGNRDRNRGSDGAGGIGLESGGGGRDGGKDGGKDSGGKGGSARGGSARGGGGSGSGFASNFGLFKMLRPGNFSGNFSFNERFERDVNTEFQINQEYRGGLTYNFSHSPKQFKPFSKIGFLRKHDFMKWLTDFNFYLGIKQLTVGSQMNRVYETSRVRNNTEELLGIETNLLINTQVMKTWQWNRNYAVKYDLTKALKFDYNGTTQALVGEPAGVIDRSDEMGYQTYRDSVIGNLRNAGEVTSYNHNVTGSYKLPLDKLPLVNFISSDIRYQGMFRWDRAPFSQDSIGHTIQNSRNVSINAQANFTKLYSKVSAINDLLNPPRKAPRRNDVRNEDRDGFGDAEEEKVKLKINPLATIVRLIASVQNVSGTFSRNEGMILPGYDQRARYGGFDDDFLAPGAPFLLGHQNTNILGDKVGDFAGDAATAGWLVAQPFQNQQYTETFQETFNVRANLEPIKYLKIELTANRNSSRNYTSFFRFDEDLNEFVYESPNETGQFSATVLSWNTAFEKDDVDDEFNSSIWDQFLQVNRLEISERLNAATHNDEVPEVTGYYAGWGAMSQDVAIPAFVAAYLGMDAASVPLDVFKTPVAPNWRVTYDGLTKSDFFKQYFKRFNLSHSYRSTLTTNYVTNLNYEDDDLGNPVGIDQSEFGNYISERQFNVVSLSEQLSPLIGVDMTFNTASENEPQLKMELKRDRNVAFGLTNYQITETKSNALVVGLGYKFKNVPNPFIKTYGKLPIKMLKETDLVLRADLNIRDNRTIIRKIEERQNQVTAGQKLISIKVSADLEISDKITMRAFYDHQITDPYISTSFATSNIRSGVALRFSLNQ